MKYMGSKSRFANDILPIMLNDRLDTQPFVEPFAGGMNTIDKVSGVRIASDNNKYLIALWKGLQNNTPYPIHITKEFYSDVRNCYNAKNYKYSDFIIGWVGFMGSANGRFFDGGFSGKTITKNGTIRNYIAESIRNIRKQIPLIKDVEFITSDYRNLNIPLNSIVYCDKPYFGAKEYSTSKKFNHADFWDWARLKHNQGYKIYVSEYSAPPDFICIWEKKQIAHYHRMV